MCGLFWRKFLVPLRKMCICCRVNNLYTSVNPFVPRCGSVLTFLCWFLFTDFFVKVGIEVTLYDYVGIYLFFHVQQHLFYKVNFSNIWCICIYNFITSCWVVPLTNLYCSFLSLLIILSLQFTLCESKITTLFAFGVLVHKILCHSLWYLAYGFLFELNFFNVADCWILYFDSVYLLVSFNCSVETIYIGSYY